MRRSECLQWLLLCSSLQALGEANAQFSTGGVQDSVTDTYKNKGWLSRYGSVLTPSAVDWRKGGFVTESIYDQGRCSACYAIAASQAISALSAIKYGVQAAQPLSIAQAIECDPSNLGCSGGWPSNALAYSITTGLATATDFKAAFNFTAYKPGDNYNPLDIAKCPDTAAAQNQAVKKTVGLEHVPLTEVALAKAVANQPVVVVIDASAEFMQYTGGVFHGACSSETAKVNAHALLLVGYTATEWILKNSWGSYWGENGFVRLPRGQNKCGIVNWASYPTLDPVDGLDQQVQKLVSSCASTYQVDYSGPFALSDIANDLQVSVQELLKVNPQISAPVLGGGTLLLVPPCTAALPPPPLPSADCGTLHLLVVTSSTSADLYGPDTVIPPGGRKLQGLAEKHAGGLDPARRLQGYEERHGGRCNRHDAAASGGCLGFARRLPLAHARNADADVVAARGLEHMQLLLQEWEARTAAEPGHGRQMLQTSDMQLEALTGREYIPVGQAYQTIACSPNTIVTAVISKFNADRTTAIAIKCSNQGVWYTGDWTTEETASLQFDNDAFAYQGFDGLSARVDPRFGNINNLVFGNSNSGEYVEFGDIGLVNQARFCNPGQLVGGLQAGFGPAVGTGPIFGPADGTVAIFGISLLCRNPVAYPPDPPFPPIADLPTPQVTSWYDIAQYAKVALTDLVLANPTIDFTLAPPQQNNLTEVAVPALCSPPLQDPVNSYVATCSRVAVVQPGDTCASLAISLGISLSLMKAYNKDVCLNPYIVLLPKKRRLASRRRHLMGTKVTYKRPPPPPKPVAAPTLKVCAMVGTDYAPGEQTVPAGCTEQYTVGEGDTAAIIAAVTGYSVDTLRSLNPGKFPLKVGTLLCSSRTPKPPPMQGPPLPLPPNIPVQAPPSPAIVPPCGLISSWPGAPSTSQTYSGVVVQTVSLPMSVKPVQGIARRGAGAAFLSISGSNIVVKVTFNAKVFKPVPAKTILRFDFFPANSPPPTNCSLGHGDQLSFQIKWGAVTSNTLPAGSSIVFGACGVTVTQPIISTQLDWGMGSAALCGSGANQWLLGLRVFDSTAPSHGGTPQSQCAYDNADATLLFRFACGAACPTF